MFSDDPKNERRRIRRKAKRQNEIQKKLQVWHEPLPTTKKVSPSESSPPSLGQILSIASAQFNQFYPIARQSVPNLPDINECRPQFLEMVRQHYQALQMPHRLPLCEPETNPKKPPIYLDPNWKDMMQHPEPLSRVRGSSMVVKLGMCGIRGFLEEVHKDKPKFKGDYRPNKAMRDGAQAHKEMHLQEKAAVASLAMRYPVSLTLEGLCELEKGLVYIEEQGLRTEFDYQGTKVPVTGTPDRMFSAGKKSPIFILEGKTNLFESELVIGYIGQKLIYAKTVYDWLKQKAPEQAKKRKIITLLTESLNPLTEEDLLPLAQGDHERFLASMKTYARKRKKVLVIQEYGFMERALVHGLIYTIIESRQNPHILQAASSLKVCHKYHCPWMYRDCDAYKKLKESQSL